MIGLNLNSTSIFKFLHSHSCKYATVILFEIRWFYLQSHTKELWLSKCLILHVKKKSLENIRLSFLTAITYPKYFFPSWIKIGLTAIFPAGQVSFKRNRSLVANLVQKLSEFSKPRKSRSRDW